MKTNFKASEHAFSLLEIILAIVLFAGVSLAIWRLSGASQRFNTEASSMAQQNAYSTLRAQIALQGLNPTSVTNFAAPVLTDTGGNKATPFNPTADLRNMGFVRSLVASFEIPAMVTANGANRAQAGSVQRTAINYQTPSLSLQTAKGIGFGYAIGSIGVAIPSSITPLAAPTFNYNGDLSSAVFPLNGIIAYPSNPPGTTYHYTTDGTPPTAASPLWVNNPGWTNSTGMNPFPQTATIIAFNTDPQYSPSAPVTAIYSYNNSSVALSVTFSRVDGRSDLYDFTYNDLQNAPTAGIILTPSVPGATILYTTDGSNPLSSVTAYTYTGAFTPVTPAFSPNVILTVVATSTNPQYATSPLAIYTLTPEKVALPDPVITTDNSLALQAGSGVSIDFGNPVSDSDPSAWLYTPAGGTSLGDDPSVTLN
jgi:type II secretory pathway pseudopilin PulG